MGSTTTGAGARLTVSIQMVFWRAPSSRYQNWISRVRAAGSGVKSATICFQPPSGAKSRQAMAVATGLSTAAPATTERRALFCSAKRTANSRRQLRPGRTVYSGERRRAAHSRLASSVPSVLRASVTRNDRHVPFAPVPACPHDCVHGDAESKSHGSAPSPSNPALSRIPGSSPLVQLGDATGSGGSDTLVTMLLLGRGVGSGPPVMAEVVVSAAPAGDVLEMAGSVLDLVGGPVTTSVAFLEGFPVMVVNVEGSVTAAPPPLPSVIDT